MADFELDILINAPLETVWQSWDRFGDIAKFSKGLRTSALLAGSPATGQGAKRRCDLKNGKSYLLEEIRTYTPMERMDIAVFESNLPVKSALLQLRFSAPTASTTRITAAMTFTLKYGLLGRLMKIPARKEFRGDITRLLAANKAYTEAT